jgi:hypothetical protein
VAAISQSALNNFRCFVFIQSFGLSALPKKSKVPDRNFASVDECDFVDRF